MLGMHRCMGPFCPRKRLCNVKRLQEEVFETCFHLQQEKASTLISMLLGKVYRD